MLKAGGGHAAFPLSPNSIGPSLKVANSREAASAGLVKVLTPPGSDKILGSRIVGEHAVNCWPESRAGDEVGPGPWARSRRSIHDRIHPAEATNTWRRMERNHAPQTACKLPEAFHDCAAADRPPRLLPPSHPSFPSQGQHQHPAQHLQGGRSGVLRQHRWASKRRLAPTPCCDAPRRVAALCGRLLARIHPGALALTNGLRPVCRTV